MTWSIVSSFSIEEVELNREFTNVVITVFKNKVKKIKLKSTNVHILAAWISDRLGRRDEKFDVIELTNSAISLFPC